MLIVNTRPVILQVIYYMPDYPTLLQEFTWGYDDRVPELMRTHKFLNHWRTNIDAVIAEILLSVNDGDRPRKWRSIDEILNLN